MYRGINCPMVLLDGRIVTFISVERDIAEDLFGDYKLGGELFIILTKITSKVCLSKPSLYIRLCNNTEHLRVTNIKLFSISNDLVMLCYSCLWNHEVGIQDKCMSLILLPKASIQKSSSAKTNQKISDTAIVH